MNIIKTWNRMRNTIRRYTIGSVRQIPRQAAGFLESIPPPDSSFLQIQEQHFIMDCNLMQQLMREQLHLYQPHQTINAQNLRKGQRYLFVERAPHQKQATYYRANFVHIVNSTIIVDIQQKNVGTIHKNSILSTPLQWIVQVITLDQITREKTRLPPEIMDIIDSYL